MEIGNYRPWGMLPWVLTKVPPITWGFIGSLGTEERSLACWQSLQSLGVIARTRFAVIEDPPSPRYSAVTSQKIKERRAEYMARGGAAADIHTHDLFERYSGTIKWIESFLSVAGPNIIIDITSLPKRFFFPIMKIALKNGAIKNLIVTYTVPAAYPSEPLAENFEVWRSLPLFGGSLTSPSDLIIVGVGYLAMGLPEELEQGGPDRLIKLMFPFPDNPISYNKTWGFVRKIEKNIPSDRIEIKQVCATDTSDAFDHLLSMTDNAMLTALFAPYGPKPMSLAMCIFSILTDSPVYYTQPKNYNPNYSIGMSYYQGAPETYAYCVRLNGLDFYSIPKP
jgi:hypothetical protein